MIGGLKVVGKIGRVDLKLADNIWCLKSKYLSFFSAQLVSRYVWTGVIKL
jgi:hypothetical protein